MDKNNDFRAWYIETSSKSGGLITQKIAALLSELSESQISRRIKTGEIESYQHRELEKGLISLPCALNLQRKRAKNKKEKPSKNNGLN